MRRAILAILAIGVLAGLSLPVLAETDPEKAEKSVAKGGEHWSAPRKYARVDSELLPGKRVLIWPVDDQVYEVENNQVTIKFQWVLRPGQTPFKKRQGMNLAIDSPTDPEFKASTVVSLPADEREGAFEVKLPVGKLGGQGEQELVLHLRLTEAQSNLVKIKTNVGRLARQPRIVR